MSESQKLLRIYIVTTAILLCLTLVFSGVAIAGERTRFMAEGTPAAAQGDTRVAAALARLPDMPDARRLLRAAAALPAPFGSAAALVLCTADLLQYVNFE